MSIEQYSQSECNDQLLVGQQLGIVALTRPVEAVGPGMQIGLSMDRGRLILSRLGRMLVDDKVRTAAGRLMQQFAYASDLGPGHAGVFTHPTTQEVEILASPRVTSQMRQLGRADYLGYFHLIDTQGLPEGYERFSEASSSAQQLAVVKTLGVTLADASAMLCPETLNTLVDPRDHPIVGDWIRSVGLRQNEAPGL